MITDTRPITESELEKLKPLCQRHKTSLWGKESMTTPTIVHTVFGDGGSMVTLEPMDSRPDYYVFLADSSFTCFGDVLDFMRDHQELVLQAIEEEYGNVDDQEYDEEGNGIETDEPNYGPDGDLVLSTSSGYTTGYFYEQPFKKETE